VRYQRDGEQGTAHMKKTQLVVNMKKRELATSKRQRAKKFRIFLLIFVLLSIVSAGLTVVGYETYSPRYQQDLSLAQQGMQHLQQAETLLKALPENPLDAQTVGRAQREFAAASAAFVQVNDDLKSLPGVLVAVPVYGARLQAALDLLPIAIELSQTGDYGCNVLNLLISRLQHPMDTSSQGLTMTDFYKIGDDFQQIKSTVTLAIHQFNHLPASDLQAAPGLSTYSATFQQAIPLLQTWLQAVEKLLPTAPALLGIGTPGNYLIEILDSTELRPGGGFLGSYGIATLSGGHLASVTLSDSYLLDNAYTATGQSIPFPPAYAWFDLASAWGLRDSNLEADFPTDARYAEEIYQREGGKVPLQGVIALTPALIEQALVITGPISVPEYHELVTSDNLLDRIHYYLLGPGYEGGSVPSPDGLSSVNQHFVAVLGKHLLARVRELPDSAISKLLQLVISSVHSKDLQVYLNASAAESVLQSYHMDAAIQAPAGDSLFVVDANIATNKASNLITSTLDDQVTIDTRGNAVHHTTLRYAWLTNGEVYGSPVYRDYVRVYVPANSVLRGQDGWQPRGTNRAFGREVWAGLLTLSYGQTKTITLDWVAPGAVTKDGKGWHYRDLIQRQAGSQWRLDLRVTLPACAAISHEWGGLAPGQAHTLVLTQSLNEDISLGVDYVCQKA
jgi:hypothetical protein